MKLYVSKKKIIFCAIILSLVIIIMTIKIHTNIGEKIVLGANLLCLDYEENNESNELNEDNEKFFRASNLPVLNSSNEANTLINLYSGVKVDDIEIPTNYLVLPEYTIINYFSVLREAANPVRGKYTGCGTLGRAKEPYPIAYNFFTKTYKNSMSYNKYVDSFRNILHINLIKLKEIPTEENTKESLKYFYEIETIQGTEFGAGAFVYYYGYIYLERIDDIYKIDNMTIIPEEYLCAPYHRWDYDGKLSVLIRYGEWCNLLKEIDNITIDGYVKNIYFKGNDGNEYRIEFYILTNDYDIEIAQFRKNEIGEWERIKINPEDCIKKEKL